MLVISLISFIVTLSINISLYSIMRIWLPSLESVIGSTTITMIIGTIVYFILDDYLYIHLDSLTTKAATPSLLVYYIFLQRKSK